MAKSSDSIPVLSSDFFRLFDNLSLDAANLEGNRTALRTATIKRDKVSNDLKEHKRNLANTYAFIKEQEDRIHLVSTPWFYGTTAFQPQLWCRGGCKGKIRRARRKLQKAQEHDLPKINLHLQACETELPVLQKAVEEHKVKVESAKNAETERSKMKARAVAENRSSELARLDQDESQLLQKLQRTKQESEALDRCISNLRTGEKAYDDAGNMLKEALGHKQRYDELMQTKLPPEPPAPLKIYPPCPGNCGHIVTTWHATHCCDECETSSSSKPASMMDTDETISFRAPPADQNNSFEVNNGKKKQETQEFQVSGRPDGTHLGGFEVAGRPKESSSFRVNGRPATQGFQVKGRPGGGSSNIHPRFRMRRDEASSTTSSSQGLQISGRPEGTHSIGFRMAGQPEASSNFNVNGRPTTHGFQVKGRPGWANSNIHPGFRMRRDEASSSTSQGIQVSGRPEGTHSGGFRVAGQPEESSSGNDNGSPSTGEGFQVKKRPGKGNSMIHPGFRIRGGGAHEASDCNTCCVSHGPRCDKKLLRDQEQAISALKRWKQQCEDHKRALSGSNLQAAHKFQRAMDEGKRAERLVSGVTFPQFVQDSYYSSFSDSLKDIRYKHQLAGSSIGTFGGSQTTWSILEEINIIGNLHRLLGEELAVLKVLADIFREAKSDLRSQLDAIRVLQVKEKDSIFDSLRSQVMDDMDCLTPPPPPCNPAYIPIASVVPEPTAPVE